MVFMIIVVNPALTIDEILYLVSIPGMRESIREGLETDSGEPY